MDELIELVIIISMNILWKKKLKELYNAIFLVFYIFDFKNWKGYNQKQIGIELNYSNFPGLNGPFFAIGGNFGNGSNAGAFAFLRTNAHSNYNDGLRPSLVSQ